MLLIKVYNYKFHDANNKMLINRIYIFLGISTKLHPLIFNLLKINKIIIYSTNTLDCLDWKLDILCRDSNTECEYSEDALDKLISCAKLLTDDIRQITSFIKVILILVFKSI